MQRKLAAILSADVQGYSRLMEDDEEATIRTLTSHREAMERLIEQHRGRVVDTPGDNLLAEFASAVDAVKAAVSIQEDLGSRNAELPETRRMPYRIGINLGDVVTEGARIYGDGVNIAARIESLAEGGGICISEAVHMQIENKLDLRHEDLGAHDVKNIRRPVRVYRVRVEEPVEAHASASQPSPALPDRPSIVVLPFDNMSADPEQEYFSDGITEDIITDLSKVSGLFVIARNSAFVYKGRSVDVEEVSRKLGVRYVLEGSVRRAANRLRITAQLIDGSTAGHLWGERFDADLDDVFAVQDEVTSRIVSALHVALTFEERANVEHVATRSPEAYDYFLRARELTRRYTKGAVLEGRSLLERAIEIDPNFAGAWGALAHGNTVDYHNAWSDSPEESLARGLELSQKAVELDERDPDVQLDRAFAQHWAKHSKQALFHIDRAIELAPGHSLAHAGRAMILHYAGDSMGTLAECAIAMRLDPHYHDISLHLVGQAHFMLGHYEQAADAFRRRLRVNPHSDISNAWLAACCGHLDQRDDAHEAWHRAIASNPDYSWEQKRRILPYANPRDFDRVIDGLAKAGLPVG